MKRLGKGLRAVVVVTGVLAAGAAQAAWPVIDVAALAQLRQQVASWRQQLTGMQQQLAQLQQTHAALTGSRGLQTLLPIPTAARNYLPSDWAAIEQVLAGRSAQYGALAQTVQAGIAAATVLPAGFVAGRSAGEREAIEGARTHAAWLAATSRAAYAQTSARFSELQQLITAVGQVTDAKATADLQARIASEQAMLANEQAKLELLAQLGQAEQATAAARQHEAAIAGHGTFATRFQPTLP